MFSINTLSYRFVAALFPCFLLLTLITVHAQSTKDNGPSLQPAPSTLARITGYLRKGELYADEKPDSAMYYLRQALHLATQPSHQPLRAKAYSALTLLYFRKADFTACSKQIEALEQMKGNSPLDSVLLKARIFKAMIYRNQGDYSKGLRYSMACLHDYQKNPQRFGREVAWLYSELGVLYDDLGNKALALKYHLQRLAFSKKGKQVQDLVKANNNLAYFYLKDKKYSQARFYTLQSLHIAQQVNYSVGKAGAYEHLGTIAYEEKHYPSAVLLHQQALRIRRQLGTQEITGDILAFLAKDYEKLRDYSRALFYVQQSIDVLTAIKSPYYLLEALDTKSRVLATTGHYKWALQVTLKAHALQDSLLGLDKQKVVAQLEAKYDLERKQTQISALQKNLRLQQQSALLQAELSHQQRLFYGFSLVLLLLLLSVSYYSLQKGKKAQKQLLHQHTEITQQSEKLAQLNQTKDKLFSLISHDLRSPVAHLKSAFRQFHQTPLSAAILPKALTQLENQVDIVLDLLTNLLDWSHSQINGFRSDPQPQKLIDIVKNLEHQLTDQLDYKKIALINQISDSLHVRVDKHQCSAILRNILANAVKFTPAQGYILLRASNQDHQVKLTVQDTGIGMSAEQVVNLFTNPQIRAGTQGEPSTGLGLQLCQYLLAQQEGSMQVTSQLHQGTTVHLFLPRAD